MWTSTAGLYWAKGALECEIWFAILIKDGNKKILLNLRDVDYIDSSGLGELVNAFTSMRSQGGELKLLNLTKRVRALLQITKLLTIFDITDDEAISVKSFSPAISPSLLPEPIMG